MTTIGFVGLNNSHPFSDAAHLRSLSPDVAFGVLEPDLSRRARFLAAHPDAEIWDSMDDMHAATPDAVVVTLQPRHVSEAVRSSLAARIPTIVTKPAATNEVELRCLEETVTGLSEHFLSSSILRFAPALSLLDGRSVSGTVVVQHDISYWELPESRWQLAAGGLVPMIGVHAFELLERCLGPSLTVLEASVECTGLDGSPTMVIGRASSVDGVVEFVIDGSRSGEAYSVEVSGPGGDVSVRLPDGPDGFGYGAFARHVLDMAQGEPSPVPWGTTRAVLRAIVETRGILGL